MHAKPVSRYGPAMLGAAAAMPGWAWWGAAFLLFTGLAMWRSRRRARAGADGPSIGADDGWGALDHLAMGGAWLSLLLLWIGAILDFGNVDFGRSLGGL